MKDIKDIFNNKRLSFLEFSRNPKSECIIGGFTIEPKTNKRLNFKFTKANDWEHLSVSMPNKCPSWEQMCFMKEQFWEDNEACVEYHPKKEDYVNNHNYCLHIWRPYNVELPIPPSIMVGIRNTDDLQYVTENIDKYTFKDAIKDEFYIPRKQGLTVH